MSWLLPCHTKGEATTRTDIPSRAPAVALLRARTACRRRRTALAVDEVRRRRGQEDQRADQVLQLTPPAGRRALADPRAELLVGDQRIVELGVEVARPEAVDLDPGRAEVSAHSLGQQLQSALGRGVRRDTRAHRLGACSSAASSRPFSTTVQPAACSPSASARPIPRLDPVTRAVRPEMSKRPSTFMQPPPRGSGFLPRIARMVSTIAARAARSPDAVGRPDGVGWWHERTA